ncbi:trimeric intracellular cation channel family protein [Desulfoluna spongiiphila]|uniref:Uncharacterized membrane protein YeiH n=1 Tax=Desulfoluna spongiiphila TaxID=419481 RepID=A0A1G5HHR3_9BACT|nr:trimeric intracellular cation channel family protein [Desulfoluna spongiiphila]SCY63402.1 Uncharacterized membrane protein YeiH [Desulfoluna spongiiphila]VVS93453.1 uncharacterised domain upf0126 [Desulfoluna spongiiphila]
MIIYLIGMMGIAAFSVTGVVAAGKKDMDLFSIILLGVVTALGGGTIRDILMDANPIFWIGDETYLWVSVAAALIAFFFIRFVNNTYTLFLYADSFGMCLFTITAAEKALSLGFSYPVAVLMGLTTGIAGGMIRDILTGKMPLLLGREFYATPALLGASLFCVLLHLAPDHPFNRYYGLALAFGLRCASIHWDLYYPRFLLYKGNA